MEINLNAAFHELDGSVVKEEGGEPLLLRKVLSTSLTKGMGDMDPERAWELAQSIFSAGDTIAIKTEDVSQIKGMVKAYPWFPFVKAQAYKSIEGPAECV